LIEGCRSFVLSFFGFVCISLPIILCLADFICLFAHFVVPIRRLDELTKDAVVRVDAMGESRDLFERREDALGMSILGVRQEFNIIGFDTESRLFNKVLVNCVEPPHKELCSLRGIVKLGVAVLVGLVEVCCCTFDRFD
jgi:hypothetical protein